MPDIISRKDAAAKGLRKYFTGEPCKNNHTSPRYVQSGTCEDCIRESKGIIISPPGEVMIPENPRAIAPATKAKLDLQQAKLALQYKKLELQLQNNQIRMAEKHIKSVVKSKLIDITLVVYSSDYDFIAAIIWAFAIGRDSLLRREDIVTGREPSDHRYVFRCFPEDYDAILQVAEEKRASNNREFIKARLVEIDEMQQKLLESGDDSNWPEGDPIL